MNDLVLKDYISYIGLICLLIASFWGYKSERNRKEEGSFKYIQKDPKWKKTYIWQVFFRRPFYRPCASSFPYVIFIAPGIFMMYFWSINLMDIAINGKAVKLEEMKKASGVVTKAHYGKQSFIKVKDEQGNENEYRTNFSSDEEVEEFMEKTKNIKVAIWYQDKWLFERYNYVQEIKVNNKVLTINDFQIKYNYERNLKIDKSSFPNLLWWMNYSLIGWFWIWLLNRRELPIHRLNKRKHYKKNKLKDV